MDTLPMVIAVGSVIEFKSKNPNCMDEEAIEHVVRTTPGSGIDKRAAIAGANSALKILRKNPRATKKEVMQSVMNESSEIFARLNAESD